MKRLLNGTLLVLIALVAAGTTYAQSTSRFCNNALIAGAYGFIVQGAKLAGPPGTPVGAQIGVAMTEFDGKGNLTQIDTVTIGGNKVADFTHTPANGTYTVNPDCTGTFTINFTDGRPTVVTNFVVVSNGNEIDTVVISPGGGVLATGSIGKRRFVGLF